MEVTSLTYKIADSLDEFEQIYHLTIKRLLKKSHNISKIKIED